MQCDKCKNEDSKGKLTYSQGEGFLCSECYVAPVVYRQGTPHFIETVNFKNYQRNGGNVSKARVEMIRSRRMAPDGNGEAVLTRNGRITDRSAEDY